MRTTLTALRRVSLLLITSLGLMAGHAQAQAIKGANWLRLDHNYGAVGTTDPRRVGWNLEVAQDVGGGMLGWPANYVTLNAQYGIKTLMRLGYYAKPTTTERDALLASGFSCQQITTLMSQLDGEAAQVPSNTLTAVGGFILGNEPNLADEWNIDGRGYGRVYACYMTRWNQNTTLGAKRLLAAGPGGCHDGTCPAFYSTMFDAMGATIDGFAIHAYGPTSAEFKNGFRWQVDQINASSNLAARNKPIYITEFNAGASEDAPLPVAPTAAYFNGVMTEVRDFNAANANQIKALMYFIDSPSPWDRNGHLCHPAVANPPTHDWWQTSLCFNGTWRQYWLDSQPSSNAPPRNATIALSGIPSFMMPGQIKRFTATATNTGSETWAGAGASNWFRLGATGINGFTFRAFPNCGGYANSTLDARIYTCTSIAPNATNAYKVDARAPTSATNATFNVRMVRDGIEWFGQSASRAVPLGQAYCGKAVTQCILNARPDILPFYQGNGWSTACSNRDAIVNDWCNGLDPAACNALKAGTCATFNNTCRCPSGRHKDGSYIDPNGTFCGYQVCGMDSKVYSCSTSNTWTNTQQTCN